MKLSHVKAVFRSQVSGEVIINPIEMINNSSIVMNAYTNFFAIPTYSTFQAFDLFAGQFQEEIYEFLEEVDAGIDQDKAKEIDELSDMLMYLGCIVNGLKSRCVEVIPNDFEIPVVTRKVDFWSSTTSVTGKDIAATALHINAIRRKFATRKWHNPNAVDTLEDIFEAYKMSIDLLNELLYLFVARYSALKISPHELINRTVDKLNSRIS